MFFFSASQGHFDIIKKRSQIRFSFFYPMNVLFNGQHAEKYPQGISLNSPLAFCAIRVQLKRLSFDPRYSVNNSGNRHKYGAIYSFISGYRLCIGLRCTPEES